MNLGEQIKNYRTNRGYSQEDLAAKLYVSRQTISNWETDKTYPDVQSLLLLSALFDTTIDELVKGDIETMKEAIDANKMKTLSWVMLVGVVAALLTIAPSMKLWGNVGLVLPFALWAVAMVAAILVECLKKKHDVKTYSEILAFVEGKPLDREKAARERKRLLWTKILMVIAVGLVAGLLTYGSLVLFFD
ncbi:MAG: helix-turn-helix transcriptional regulator [Raoultibacter sp.]